MAALIYGSCAITSFICCVLLFRAYRSNSYRLLLWGGFCFMGLTLNNIILVIDKLVVGQETDLSIWRSSAALLSASILLYGLIWDTE